MNWLVVQSSHGKVFNIFFFLSFQFLLLSSSLLLLLLLFVSSWADRTWGILAATFPGTKLSPF